MVSSREPTNLTSAKSSLDISFRITIKNFIPFISSSLLILTMAEPLNFSINFYWKVYAKIQFPGQVKFLSLKLHFIGTDGKFPGEGKFARFFPV